MKRTATETGARLLGAMILAAIIASSKMPNILEVSAPYLMASSCAGLYSFLTSVAARSELRKGHLDNSKLWFRQSAARIFHLVAWQLAILGALNVCADQLLTTRVVLIVVCLAMIAWVYISDRWVALTDRRDQYGGIRPMKFLGQLRTRRLFFWALIFYPAVSLLLAGFMLFANGRSYPSPFQPVQFFTLFITVLSAGTAALAFERYRGSPAKKQWSSVLLIGVILILFFSGFFWILLGRSLYTFVLSSLTVVSVAVSASLLLRAVRGESDVASGAESDPHSSSPFTDAP